MSIPRVFCLLVALTASQLSLAAAPQIVPVYPAQFERVHLRFAVDDCALNESSVLVEGSNTRLAVRYAPLLLCSPGQTKVVDVQLGAFPPGDYHVDVFSGGADPTDRLTFHVSGIAYPAVYPPVAFPLADYSGLWGTANEAGWGLSLYQGAAHLIFGALFVFDAQGTPEWYTLQAGTWQTSTRWVGKVILSDGPSWAAPTYAPDGAHYTPIGAATLDFGMVPGHEDRARFIYTANGQTATKIITRSRL